MTTTNTKATREPTVTRPAARPEARPERTRRIGREVGMLAVNAYERGVADVVALERDAAKIVPQHWAQSALTLGAGLVEDVGAAYVKTARAALR
jgi:hypothetical protein